MTLFQRLFRYATVSAISTVLSLSTLGILVETRAVPAGWANVIATSVGIIPSFELNRRWVWGKSGQRSVLAEIGPFCAMSFAGLALSTVTVSAAASYATHAGFSNEARTVLALLANIGAFGTLWLAQFVILDRVLFRVKMVQ